MITWLKGQELIDRIEIDASDSKEILSEVETWFSGSVEGLFSDGSHSAFRALEKKYMLEVDEGVTTEYKYKEHYFMYLGGGSWAVFRKIEENI